MAKEHTCSGFNGEPMTRREAEQKIADIRALNAKVGACGYEQRIVGNDRDGYKVIESLPSKKQWASKPGFPWGDLGFCYTQ